MKKGAVYFFLFVLAAFTQIGCLSGYDFDPQNPPQEKLTGPIISLPAQDFNLQLIGSRKKMIRFGMQLNYLRLTLYGPPGKYQLQPLDGDSYITIDNKPAIEVEITDAKKPTMVLMQRNIHLKTLCLKTCVFDVSRVNATGLPQQVYQLHIKIEWLAEAPSRETKGMVMLTGKTHIPVQDYIKVGETTEINRSSTRKEVRMSSGNQSSSPTHHITIKYDFGLLGAMSINRNNVSIRTNIQCGDTMPTRITKRIPNGISQGSLTINKEDLICRGAVVHVWTEIINGGSETEVYLTYMARKVTMSFF